MKCPHCHRELFEGDEIDGSWDREVDRKAANWELMRTIMAGLAEFERDLIRERVKSGLASARARGVMCGRKHFLAW